MIADSNDCSFCAKFDDKTSNKLMWYDKEVISRDDFAVIPALGPLVEGYLLILTRRHYQSMAHLNKPLLSELNILRREVRDLLTKRYSHPIAFEHGPGLPIGMGGGCIDHAHIHVLPSEIDLLPLLSKYDMKLIGDTNYTYEIERKDRPYLLYEDQRGHIYMGNGENVPSQFIRRIIANELGIPDQWDYAVFPKYELIEATIDKLTV